jgi:hypothetical protein
MEDLRGESRIENNGNVRLFYRHFTCEIDSLELPATITGYINKIK